MASLAEIRAKLSEMESKNSNTAKTSADNAIYPFWNIDEGQNVTFRFLPDADSNNTFFWVERQMIRLTFPGILGGENKPVTVQVPCGEMYGDSCPVLTEVRPWFKDSSLEDMGRKYWKKKSYLFQGFVIENPLIEETPENPIRRFVIGSQVFNIIKAALMDPDMENIPTDYVNGTDFRLNKTQKGGYADYSTSKWSRKERSLSQAELSAIDQYGLYNLKDFLPARPSAEQYTAIAEMFAASVDGEQYDLSRWGNMYKPYGLEPQSTTATVQAASAPAQRTVKPAAGESTKVATPPAASIDADATGDKSKRSADDILAMIRNRNSSQ